MPNDIQNLPMEMVHEDTLGGSTLDADILNFVTEAPQVTAPLPTYRDITELSTQPDSAHLGNYLSRPVRIHSFDWAFGSGSFHIDPWTLFLNDTRVKVKTDTFKYLRGSLRIEVQLNGTPFHFGRILCSYEPANGNRTSLDGDFRQHSSIPSAFLNPSTNAITKFTAPFMKPELWIDLKDPDGAQLGVLNFDVVTPLAVFDGLTPDPVSVQVYAWMEDVELAFPTMGITAIFTAQGKKGKVKVSQAKKDEYEVKPNAGLISGPAATVAAGAAYFKSIPYIGPFATAAEIGATAVSTIAKIFGYSAPRDLTLPNRIIQRPLHNLALTDSVVPVDALTVNSKSELSIDPGIIGMDCGEDELAVNAIAGKWTLMRAYNWNRTQPIDTELVQLNVGPDLLSTFVPVTQAMSMSSMAFASLPFNRWTGDIQVKIEVVCSRYHRGRLRFQWTPEFTLASTLNNGYSTVVDISDTQTFIIKCPFVSPEGYLLVKNPIEWIDFFHPQYHSGYLRVIVQNELNAPSDGDIQILVSVRAGPTFRLADPTTSMVSNIGLRRAGVIEALAGPGPVFEEGESFHVPVSGVSAPMGEIAPIPKLRPQATTPVFTPQASTDLGEAAERDVKVITFFEDEIHPHYDKAYYGDPVLSFRALIKRYAFHTTLANTVLPVTASANIFQMAVFEHPALPRPRTYTDAGLTLTDYYENWAYLGGASANAVQTHLASYLSLAFLAKKGSFRWTAMTSGGPSELSAPMTATRHSTDEINISPYEVKTMVCRYGAGYTNSGQNFTVAAPYPAGAQAAMQLTGAGATTGAEDTSINSYSAGGQTLFSANENGVCSYEVPFYNSRRYVTSMGEIPNAKLTQQVRLTVPTATSENAGTRVNLFCAAGEDFTCHFFNGVPVLHFLNYVGQDDMSESYWPTPIGR